MSFFRQVSMTPSTCGPWPITRSAPASHAPVRKFSHISSALTRKHLIPTRHMKGVFPFSPSVKRHDRQVGAICYGANYHFRPVRIEHRTPILIQHHEVAGRVLERHPREILIDAGYLNMREGLPRETVSADPPHDILSSCPSF